MRVAGKIFFSLVFLVAGIVHIMKPEVFNPAIFWGMETLSNYAAGILEIILAVLIWASPDLGARASAIWLMILIPVHIHIAAKGIPIFGVSDPLVLWGRTFLQLPLIYGAWSIRNADN